MTNPTTRRVHIRRDSENRWFWYHYQCHSAQALFPTQPDALTAALSHSCKNHRSTFYGHIEVDPDRNNLSASWLCPSCKQYCASHNPCDCCSSY
jgi:hypothetical protein